MDGFVEILGAVRMSGQAEHRAHMTRMALRSAQVRRRRASERGLGLSDG